MAGLDDTIGDVALSVDLRHRTLKLALIFVCAVNQRSLNSYFLRRGGLFGTLVQLIGDPATEQTAYEAAMLLSVLANFQRFETRNPFLQRLEDLVDDGVMAIIIQALSRMVVDSRQYVRRSSRRFLTRSQSIHRHRGRHAADVHGLAELALRLVPRHRDDSRHSATRASAAQRLGQGEASSCPGREPFRRPVRSRVRPDRR